MKFVDIEITERKFKGVYGSQKNIFPWFSVKPYSRELKPVQRHVKVATIISPLVQFVRLAKYILIILELN